MNAAFSIFLRRDEGASNFVCQVDHEYEDREILVLHSSMRFAVVFTLLGCVLPVCRADDFEKKAAEVQKKTMELIEEGDKIIPAKAADNVKKMAERDEVEETSLRAYLRASGVFDPKSDDSGDACVPLLSASPKEERAIVAGKYAVAEHVLAWRSVDPKFKYLLSPTEKDPLVFEFHRKRLEITIQVLEYAKKKKLFSGQKYAAGGSEIVDELKAVLKKVDLPQSSWSPS